ncbi:MAG: hypothetical protein DRR19_24625, partial [Candidatus Parabeggiatoa sp. nov. 1]
MDQPLTSSVDDYKAKVLTQTLVSDLKRLRDFSQKLKFDQSVEQMNTLLQRIEAEKFSVAVVGEFKRGKSTFINALLGQEILPADILPTTATLNRITYNATPAAKICFKEGHEQDIAIDQLADYVTKLTSESEAAAATVKEAVVSYPVPYCENNNTDIIDTPGLSDDADLSAVTISFLNQCDAAIMVIMADSPFAMTEDEFLKNQLLTSSLGQILFVVNGVDRLNSPEDVERVINLVETRLNASILKWVEQQTTNQDAATTELYLRKFSQPKVFGLSAFQALQAKQNHDSALLAQSRFAAFETALENMLKKERGGILLQVAANQTMTAVTAMLQVVDSQASLLETEQRELEKTRQTIDSAISTLRNKKAGIVESIDATLADAKKQAESVLTKDSRLAYTLKQAAEQVINSEKMTAAEFNANPEAFQSQMAGKITMAMQKASTPLAEKVQNESQQGVSKEWEQIRNFAGDLFEEVTLHLFSFDMAQSELEALHKKVTDVVQLVNQAYSDFNAKQPTPLVLAVPNISKDFISAIDSDAGGTVLQLIAIVGAIFVGVYYVFDNWQNVDVIADVIATIFFGIFVGTLGGFLGGILGSLLLFLLSFLSIQKPKFQNDGNLRKKYQTEVLAKMLAKIEGLNTNQVIEEYVSQTFESLTQLCSQVQAEVDALIDMITKTLLEPCQQREAENASQRRELSQIRTDAQKTL